MAAAENEGTLKKGNIWSRIGLPVALIAILSLVALSFVTLGLLRRGSKPEIPAPTVANKVTQSLKPTEATGPAANQSATPAARDQGQTQPATSQPPGSEAAGTKKSAGGTEEHGAAPAKAPTKATPDKPTGDKAAPEKGGSPASPAAAAATKNPPTAKESAPKAPAETGEKSTVAKAAVATKDKTPGSEGVAGQTSSPKVAVEHGAATTHESSEPATKAPAKKEPAAADPKATGHGPFPPPPDSNKAAGVNVPKPQWQTADQEWDKNQGGAPKTDVTVGAEAAWSQIGVGQSIPGQQESGGSKSPAGAQAGPASAAAKTAATPSPATKIAPAETKTATKSAPVAPATTRAVVSPETAPTARITRTKPRVAPPSPGAGVQLTIIDESGRPGRGQAYGDVLRAMGYTVARVEERVPQPGPTTILYRSGLEAKAQALAQRIPGQRSVAPQTAGSGSDIVILVR